MVSRRFLLARFRPLSEDPGQRCGDSDPWTELRRRGQRQRFDPLADGHGGRHAGTVFAPKLHARV